jgi:hypothetical protein
MTRVENIGQDAFLGLAVSGQRYTFKNNVYKNIANDLPRLYPCSSGVELVFIDLLRELPPLSCPLLWDDTEWAIDPLSRLLTNWSGMVQVMRKVIDERITPLLKRGIRVVAIFHGFGLNLLLHAAVTREFSLESLELPVIGEVYGAHGGLVKTFFRHFSPPEYAITRGDPEEVSARMAKENSLLAGIPHLRRAQFAKFEESAIERYEASIPMQKKFHYIKASFSEAEMTRCAMDIFTNRIDRFLKAAA